LELEETHEINKSIVELSWLGKVRYVALVCYSILILLGDFYLNISTNYLLLSVILLALLVNNAVCSRTFCLSKNRSSKSVWAFSTLRTVLAISLLIDIFLVGGILYLTGGHLNPFSTMLLLYVFLVAAVLKDERWTWISFLAAGFTFGVLFVWYHPVPAFGSHNVMTDHHAHGHHTGFSAHLYGMLLSFILLGAIFSYFFSRLHRAQSAMEKQLTLLRVREVEDQKMLGLATLCAGAAHELGTPLGTMSLILEDLKQRESRESLPKKDLEELTIELSRITSVLDRMRAEPDSKIEHPEVFTLKSVVEELAERMVDFGQISVHVDGNLSNTVRTFRGGLLSSLTVLVQNAFYALAQSGHESKSILLEISEKIDSVTWTIKDEGVGMEPEELDRVGEPFFTTKDNGMGLGVYIVKSFCRLVGGRLEFLSKKGSGTSARLILPRDVAWVEGT